MKSVRHLAARVDPKVSVCGRPFELWQTQDVAAPVGCVACSECLGTAVLLEIFRFRDMGRPEPDAMSVLRMRAHQQDDCPVCYHRPLSAIGDRLQSEASRLAEWVATVSHEVQVPHEVQMAVGAVRAAVDDWSDVRARD